MTVINLAPKVCAEDAAMTEAMLLAKIIRMCEELGLKYHHVYVGRVGQVGYVDLTIAGPGGLLLRELKSALGTLSEEQEKWRTMLKASGQNYAVWTPADWRLGRIHDQLWRLADEDIAA
jgi:hypothetical protein